MSQLDEVRAEFPATVTKNGAVLVDEPRRFERWLHRHPGLRVVLVFADEHARADNRFFRRYRGYIVKPFSDWSGYERDEAHELLLSMFSTFEHKLPSGAVVSRKLRTRSMTDEQFAAYINRCERWLVDQGCPIPERRERVA